VPEPESLWDFALRVYARDGVEETCIALQDTWRADIPVLLWALWTGAQGHRLSAADIKAAVAGVEVWQTRVVGPTRQVRRALRQPGPLTPALESDLQSVRAEMQKVELNAERRELEYLATAAVGAASEPGTATMSANLVAYLDFLGVPAGGRGAVPVLVDAASD